MRRGMLATVLALGLAGSLVAPVRADDDAERAAREALTAVRATLAKVHAGNCRARAAADAFDYHEIARRALGRHWRDRTHAERAELVQLVQAHLLGWYSRLCHRQDLLHFEAAVVDGDRAVLSARAIREGHAISVVYRLQSPDAKRWLVYDIEIAGRSHTRTLYGEFDRILLNEGYRDLVARLAEDRDGPRAAKAR